MPVSRSPARNAKPTQRPLVLWPMILIGLAAVLAVVVAALPASLVTHFLPKPVHAEDFSGSIWHGSMGKISVNGRDAGALEWHLHPAELLGMTVAADLHWVRLSFVIDAAVTVDRQGFTAHDLKGGGPIEDLRELGVAPGWHGQAVLKFSELKSDFTKVLAAVGDLQVSNVTAAQIAESADLGSYELTLGQGAVDADGNVTAQLKDNGGPLEVQAVIRYSAKDYTGLLTGTLKERADAPAGLLAQLQNLTQLRGRDPQGRIPVDLEFAL